MATLMFTAALQVLRLILQLTRKIERFVNGNV
jgi:hypothetical protein